MSNEVCVVHPGRYRIYESVAALQSKGLLSEFVTSFYFRDQAHPTLFRLLPSRLRDYVLRQLKRKSHPKISPSKVRSFPLPELVFMLTDRIPWFQAMSSIVARLRIEYLDRFAARQ